MSDFLSPDVQVHEIDNTLTTPQNNSSAGAAVIRATWGPVNEPVLIADENHLVSVFGKPTNSNYKDWFVPANFLAYANSCWVTRAASKEQASASTDSISFGLKTVTVVNGGSGYTNEDKIVVTGLGTGATCSFEIDEDGAITEVTVETSGRDYLAASTVVTVERADVADGATDAEFSVELGELPRAQIQNSTTYTTQYMDGAPEGVICGEFAARYMGELGDSLMVSYADSKSYADWPYAKHFGAAPATSPYAKKLFNDPEVEVNDEFHIVVVDINGKFTGVPGTVLERFEFVSKAKDGKTNDGNANFYKRVIQDRSAYVYCVDMPKDTNWGKTLVDCGREGFDTLESAKMLHFFGGADGFDGVTSGDIIEAFDMMNDSTAYDISMVMCGPYNHSVCNHVVNYLCDNEDKDAVVTGRKDCVAFISPSAFSASSVIGAPITSASVDKIREQTLKFRNDLNLDTSYGVMDTGWKYQYDKYNDEYRWIPLNGDIAGLRARVNINQNPWYSEAGMNRGAIKNCIRLSFNPRKIDRDILYPKQINPVVSFNGEGVYLYGDKTLLTRPSAFNHTNVRFLFIYLEKILSNASKYSLFEINDEVTRAHCVNLITPFLDEVLGDRGIYAYKVICDESNNTPQVIDTNRLVMDIKIQPARSINWITLNFYAEKTGSSFAEND